MPGDAEVQISRSGRDRASHARLKEKPDDAAAKAKLDELPTMLRITEIKEYKRRIAHHPGRRAFSTSGHPVRGHGQAARRSRFSRWPGEPALKVEAQRQSAPEFEPGVVKLRSAPIRTRSQAADANTSCG